MGFVVCGKPHVTLLIIRALYLFSASTYDVISAEVVDGGRCLFYFITYLFIFFIYLFAYSGRGMGEERAAPREKNESAADKDSSPPKSAIFQFIA